ncbi:MAG TPA: preprotein translocase subunit SecY [Verrucomicrobiae bacterium]|nr:preprotein translocase subunit SecY [Verrucomicrobiae bacterium]
MFSTFLNCWKIPELRRRILFTLGIVALARVGAAIPCPGVDPSSLNEYINRIQSQVGGSFVGLAMLLTGGGLQRCAVFALGIMPYITASIIMTMITAVIPSLERLRQEGETGRAKLIQYGRYLTVFICIIQGFFLAKAFEHPQGLFPGFTGTLVANPGIGFELLTVLTITSGSVLLMWLGEQMTQHGIGNGASMIITVGIVDRLPQAIAQAWATVFAAETAVQFRILQAVLLLVMAVVVVAAVVAVTEAQRKIPVQYAKQIVGRKMRGGQQVFMPLKVNYAGVMPIIFAQAILLFPQKILGMSHLTFLQKLARSLTEGEFLYLTLYGTMILFFSYFWVATQFNPLQIADDLKKYGGYVPGIRPGKPTAEYLDRTMTRITLAGAVFLTVIAVIPYLLSHHFRLPYLTASFFGGTSLLITVGVMLDTMRQVESHLLMRHYDGFLRKGKLRGRL